MICAAVPAATTRPAAITTRRVHSSASSMLCVVTMTPAPPAAVCEIVSQSRARASGSTPDVGSSSSSSSGACASTCANPARRATPSGRFRTVVPAYRSSGSGAARPGPAEAALAAALPAPNTARENARFSAIVRSS